MEKRPAFGGYIPDDLPIRDHQKYYPVNDCPVQDALREMHTTRKWSHFMPPWKGCQEAPLVDDGIVWTQWPVAWKKKWSDQEIYIQAKSGFSASLGNDEFRLLSWYCHNRGTTYNPGAAWKGG